MTAKEVRTMKFMYHNPQPDPYNRDSSVTYVTWKTIKDNADNKEKIRLIKHYRAVSSLGLKEAKNAIESCESCNGNYDLDMLKELFASASGIRLVPEITKEELMNMISDALDAGDALHMTNALDVIELFCKNVRAKGGLEAISKERQEFLESI